MMVYLFKIYTYCVGSKNCSVLLMVATFIYNCQLLYKNYECTCMFPIYNFKAVLGMFVKQRKTHFQLRTIMHHMGCCFYDSQYSAHEHKIRKKSFLTEQYKMYHMLLFLLARQSMGFVSLQDLTPRKKEKK